MFSLVWATQENDSTGAIHRVFARTVAFGALTASAAMLVTPVIAYSEYAKERRYVFYAICGMLAPLLPLAISEPADQALTGDGLALLGMFVAIGLIAAWVDWLRAEGIGATVQREFLRSASGEMPPDQCLPEVWIDDGDHTDQALELLRILRHAPQRRWICSCGELVE